MAKENTILTIDIGGASVKMAEFSVAGDSVVLERYAVKEMPTELAENNFSAAFAVTFNDLMAENSFVSRQVRVSISSLHAFQRLSKLPPVLGNRVRAAQVVEGEAKLTVPYPLEEVIWDYQLVKHTKVFEVENEEAEDQENPDGEPLTETVEELEAFFVAVKDDLATSLATTLLDADMEILSIEVAPTAIYNAARANMFGEETCDMILDIGGRGSSLIIMDGSRVFVRSIPIGGSTITAQIAKEFNIGTADAEEMKRKHGFVALGGAYEDSDSEVATTISKIARNVLTRLHGEINRSINAWRSMYGGNRPEALFITGGSSIIPYVPHFLNEKLGLEVSFLNTFPVITIGSSIDKQELLEIAHIFPPMIGMAVRHVRTCPIEIALTPRILQATRDLKRKKPFFYASACCAVLGLLVFYQGLRARTAHDKKLEAMAAAKIKSADATAKVIDRKVNELSDAENKYNSLNKFSAARTAWVDILNDLQKHAPANMWFTQIDGVSSLSTGQPAAAPVESDPAMEDPAMAGGDPGMAEADSASAPPPAPEVAWVRLKGHTMIIAPADRKADEYFLENLKKSNLFEMDDNGVVHKIVKLYNASKINNVTSFVIYLKLKNTIKQ